MPSTASTTPTSSQRRSTAGSRTLGVRARAQRRRGLGVDDHLRDHGLTRRSDAALLIVTASVPGPFTRTGEDLGDVGQRITDRPARERSLTPDVASALGRLRQRRHCIPRDAATPEG
ncbi:hypothetical protein [Dactylosporangium sp. CA-233914]|uniref:hypothetical protein n=1 Tax=Dactylosporangium sp. CA-233914 TaxID=3239934 RepID=UPI003D942A42